MISTFLYLLLIVISIIIVISMYIMYYFYSNKPSLSSIRSAIKKALRSNQKQPTSVKKPEMELLKLMMIPVLPYLQKLPYRREYRSKLNINGNYDITIRDQVFFNYVLVQPPKPLRVEILQENSSQVNDSNTNNYNNGRTYIFIGILGEVAQL